ncbi:hypothetical protein JHK85_053964 [Glycine max]|uniref:Xyloglucan endotransglucosylase/hydrolase n=1 Tax=Glycine max TaxID=3847 RepID=A0A0R0EKA9_SOYBN|nr:hypothetical protein JHK85_053964 [Glycine max]
MGSSLWTLCIILASLASAAFCAFPRRPVNVPFGRNYVPTWAFDHIKYFKGVLKFNFILISTLLSSQNAEHDEIDFEFLGNRTGQPYILQTNVFTGGKGDREQRIFLWFDPTKAYHRYSVLWNMYQIVFLVDNIPMRVFKNLNGLGVKFPFDQPMKVYNSLWNADDWATRGGLEKTDWSKAPFIAEYIGFHIDGCEASVNAKFCATQGKRWWDQAQYRDLDASQWRWLRWVRRKYTIYNYCTDRSRYPQLPLECRRNRDI